jgi:hypothetical protein
MQGKAEQGRAGQGKARQADVPRSRPSHDAEQAARRQAEVHPAQHVRVPRPPPVRRPQTHQLQRRGGGPAGESAGEGGGGGGGRRGGRGE